MEPTAKKVISLVEMVRDKELLLPEIQRGYVWNRPQIRDLIESLYHDYPAGAIMLGRPMPDLFLVRLDGKGRKRLLRTEKFILFLTGNNALPP